MDCGYCRGIGDVKTVTDSCMPLCFICRVERGQETISMSDLITYLLKRHFKGIANWEES